LVLKEPILFSLDANTVTVGEGGEGIFNQTGGFVTTDANLVIGEESGSVGTYNLSGMGDCIFCCGPVLGKYAFSVGRIGITNTCLPDNFILCVQHTGTG